MENTIKAKDTVIIFSSEFDYTTNDIHDWIECSGLKCCIIDDMNKK